MSAVPVESTPTSRTWVTSISHAYTDTMLRARLLGESWQPGTWGWIVPLAVTVFAALLRFPGLTEPHKLIFDETYYVKDAWSLLHFGYEREWDDDVNEAFAQGNAVPLDSPSYVVHPPAGKWLIGFGMALFGSDNGFGWRFSSALAGTLSVLLVALIAQRMFRSVFLGGAAGLLLTIEGHHIVMSRTGLLDIFLSFFVLAAFAALLVDRAWGRTRLAEKLSQHPSPAHLRYGPWLGWRPWRLVAGILLGVACSVKLSGLAFVAIFGLMTVFWDMNARRVAGIRQWFVAGVVRDGLFAFVAVVVVGAITYLGTWAGWLFTSGGYYRHWGAEHPAEGWLSGLVPDWLRSLTHYHVQSTSFHSDLSSGHSYASNPWTWPFMGRPVSFHYESVKDDALANCPVSHCSEAILDLAHPLIWWSGLIALLVLVFCWLGQRDWRAGAILGAYLAGQLVWALWPERTMFFFYTIAYTPFLILAITYCLGLLLKWRIPQSAPAQLISAAYRRNTVIVLSYLLVMVLIAWFFFPIWFGEMIPYDSWRLRMWFQSWI